MREKIGGRTFEQAEIDRFGALSGDYNPIHVDPVVARRLLTGGVVVHGMFTVLWALNAHLAMGGAAAKSIAAYFPVAIKPGEPVELYRTIEDGVIRLIVVRADVEVASVILRGLGQVDAYEVMDARHPPINAPVVRTFADLKGLSGVTPVQGNAFEIAAIFPHAAMRLGGSVIAAFMALSRVVGMEAPGLHSLFTVVDIVLDLAAPTAEMRWAVTRHTAAIAPIRLSVSGGGISGFVDAIVRPAPVVQPSVAELENLLAPGSLIGHRVLVIGGSRGLGEVIAKIVGVGGGDVVVTYRDGRDDAERVATEITEWGGSCVAIAADAYKPELLFSDLKNRGWSPTHLYYLPTPKIVKQNGADFNDAAFHDFTKIYVDAFARIVKAFTKAHHDTLRVFYPSTTFLDDFPAGFAEYTAAKSAGEAMCQHLNRNVANANIVVRRLPRLRTDQTLSIIPQNVGSLVPEMARVIEIMHTSETRGRTE